MIKKRWLAALFLLWSLAAAQLVQGHMREEQRVAEVFARVGEEEREGVVEYYGIRDGEILEIPEREAFLKQIAEKLGITDYTELTSSQTAGREETSLIKEGSNATTELILLTSDAEGEPRQYIMIKITMKNNTEDTCAYRAKLDTLMESCVTVSRSCASIIGAYDGKLSLEERNEAADRLLSEMDAQVVTENREMQLYTIYAYTPWIDDYELQDNEPINLNITMHYDSAANKTYTYASIPAPL